MSNIKTMEDLEKRKMLLKTKSSIVKEELGDSLLAGKTRVEDKVSLVKLLVPAVALGALAVVLFTSNSDAEEKTKSLIDDYQTNIEDAVPPLKKPGNPQWLNIVLDTLPFLVNVFKTMLASNQVRTDDTTFSSPEELGVNQPHVDSTTIPANI